MTFLSTLENIWPNGNYIPQDVEFFLDPQLQECNRSLHTPGPNLKESLETLQIPATHRA